MKKQSERVEWLKVERLLGEMRIPRDSAAGRREFERIMESRRAEETPMTLNWIGQRLNMGTGGSVANLLRKAA